MDTSYLHRLMNVMNAKKDENLQFLNAKKDENLQF